MKDWTLWAWAFRRVKMINGKCVDCFRNKILLKIMNLSGVTPNDVREALGKLPKA